MRDLMTRVDPNLWSLISAGAFLVAFSLLVFWVFWPTRKSIYEAAAQLPVEND